MKKTGLLALGLALAIGIVAEAGSIPTNRVPLQTYAIKKVNCYLQPNGTQKGWIDPSDYVVVTQIRSDGWAYGSYPVGKGRTSRWFRADDLVNNIGFANQERYSPKSFTYTYTNPNHNKQFGSFNNNEPILVVSDSGQSRQFIYKVSGGGYKMAWVPYWDCWDARQAGKQQVNSNTINTNPIVKPVQREEKKKNNNLSCGCSNSYAGNYVVNTSKLPLTMRSGHGSNYSKIASIPKGVTVSVSAGNGTWAHVNYNGRDGYASMQYLKKVGAENVSSGLIKGVEGVISKNSTSSSLVKEKIENLYTQHYNVAQKGNCYYFAKSVFNRLFGAVANGINNGDNTYLDNYSNAYIVKKVHDVNYTEGRYKVNIPVNANYIKQVKEAFFASKPGYFVQMALRKKANSKGDCGSPHSAIVYKVEDDGVTFYEANWTKNTVSISRKSSWNTFASDIIGFTIYAPNNYKLK